MFERKYIPFKFFVFDAIKTIIYPHCKRILNYGLSHKILDIISKMHSSLKCIASNQKTILDLTLTTKTIVNINVSVF